MSLTYGFFNSVNGDRKYNAEQMSEYFRGIINEGVYQNLDGGLAVTAGTGLAVSVASGRAIVQNRWVQNSEALSLTISSPSEVYARKDAVVIRLNWNTRLITIAVKTGTPAASPEAPELTRTNEIYEMALAYISVSANATSVTVTDKRSDTTVCGWVSVAQATSGEVDAMLNAMKTGFDGVVYPSPAAMVQGCDQKLQDTINSLIIHTGKLLNNSSKFVDPYNSFDTFPNNECVLITTNPQSYVTNYPADFTSGWVLTFNYSNVTNGGIVQLVFYATQTQNGKIAWRKKWGSTWGDWFYFENTVDVKTSLTTLINAVSTDANSKLVVRGYNEVTNSTHQNLTDADNAEINRIYSIQSSSVVANLPTETVQGTLATFNYKDTAGGKIQLFHASNGVLYSRIYWSSWRSWNEYTTKTYVDTAITNAIEMVRTIPDLYASFEVMGVIGDSLASGECYDSEGHGTDIYSVSWLQFMCRAVGMTGYNFSKGGLTSKTWLTDSMGYPLASSSGKKCRAYVIGLGQNDANVGMTIGTISDINDSDYTLNADSYYGNYGGIIQRMKVIVPDAKFFLITDPLGANSTTRANYNVAVRAIASHFTNCYLIDAEADSSIFLDQDSYIYQNKVSGHYTAPSYKYISKYIAGKINNIMYNNPADFKFVQFIDIT